MTIIQMPGQRKPRGRIADQKLSLRAKLWPALTPDKLWTRQKHDGFASVPRTMPLMLGIMDDLEKGKPVGTTYFELWTRSFDECFVTLSKPREMAFAAGFTKQRGERTWRERMEILAQYGFIDVKPGPAGKMSYALIYNPYLVIRHLHDTKTAKIREDKYNFLMARAEEVGAQDFDLLNPFTDQSDKAQA